MFKIVDNTTIKHYFINFKQKKKFTIKKIMEEKQDTCQERKKRKKNKE